MWQGIPFKYFGQQLVDSANVVISKIPIIHIDSSPDLLGPGLSVLGALIGGGIPAFIAWKAINANREQMLQQQIIVNRQNFIDNLRLRMSVFTASAARVGLYYENEVLRKGFKASTAPADVRKHLLDLAYAADLEYNYIELMVSGKPIFEPVMKRMKELEDGLNQLVDETNKFDIFQHVELLTEETIKCIESECSQSIQIK